MSQPQVITCAKRKIRKHVPVTHEPSFMQNNNVDCFESELLSQPRSRMELAVHPKKVDEVASWLQLHKSGAHICLLCGPPGSGKTATVRVLANEFNFDLVEYVESISVSEADLNGWQLFDEESFSSKFEDFLQRADKYRMLATCDKFNSGKTLRCRKVLLIEEWPNYLLRIPSLLADCLRNFKVAIFESAILQT